MDEAPPQAPARPARAIWQRAVPRRTVLAAGIGVASSAAVAALWKNGDLGQLLNQLQSLTHPGSGPLSNPRIRMAHLLRRAGFGATSTEVDHFMTLGPKATTTQLLAYQQTSNAQLEAQLPVLDTMATGKGALTAAQIQAWWLQRTVQTARPLEERMTLFWHGLLTSGLDKAGPAQLLAQNQLFRQMALGNFDDLLKAISKDPAMMVYLDTETNRLGKPNENFARELMELFTTGIGHYTENDVRESARSFTGWTVRGGAQLRYTSSSVFVPRYHDSGSKTFMGKTGNFTGDDIVAMLVPLRATAERLSSRLFSYFAYPNPEREVVAHLADVFQNNRYNVGAVVKEIFSMDAFYSAKAYRALVKSPAELVVGTLKATGTDSKAFTAAAAAMSPMGQVLFYPPNVAGWPAGTSWINSSTLLSRLNFANGAAARMRAALPAASLDALLATHLDGNVSASTHDTLRDFAAAHPGDQAGLLFLVLATPEYQLS